MHRCEKHANSNPYFCEHCEAEAVIIDRARQDAKELANKREERRAQFAGQITQGIYAGLFDREDLSFFEDRGDMDQKLAQVARIAMAQANVLIAALDKGESGDEPKRDC